MLKSVDKVLLLFSRSIIAFDSIRLLQIRHVRMGGSYFDSS